MAITFPTSPTLNQQFTADNKTWIWDGEKWISSSSFSPGVLVDQISPILLAGM